MSRTYTTPNETTYLQPKPQRADANHLGDGVYCDTCWSLDEHRAGVCQGTVDPWAGTGRTPGNAATDRQLNYLTSLIVGAGEAPTPQRARALITTMFGSKPDASDVGDYIDTLKNQRQAKPARTNRYAGNCERCGRNVPAETGNLDNVEGRWVVTHFGDCPQAPAETPAPVDGLDLTLLPEGRYGVPGSDTRLKVMVRKPSKGKWAGWVFVSDAAAYGQRRNYGKQRPGGTYQGDIVEALETIAADPYAAMRKYAELTNSCGNCGRLLEDETSVELGIGPICRGKLAGEYGWQF